MQTTNIFIRLLNKFLSKLAKINPKEPNRRKFLRFSLLAALLVCISTSAYAKVKVIDGDSLFIDQTEIRLSGIDAPEYFQTCFDANDKEYPCGKLAFQALQSFVREGTRCEKIVTDKYHRQVSVCWRGDININKKMVELGWATAYKRYTDEYNLAEQEAKAAQRGIWQGRFLKPEFYRILQKERKKAQ